MDSGMALVLPAVGAVAASNRLVRLPARAAAAAIQGGASGFHAERYFEAVGDERAGVPVRF